MIKHKLYVILIDLAGFLTVSAQQDDKAREILDKVASTYKESKGMKITFKGTQKGTLWVKNNSFVLDCGGVKSWFDGETQWSYVKENDEVNISSPTPEELETVNPYALVTMYRKGYNFRYDGYKLRMGKPGQEISLFAKGQGEVQRIVLNIDENCIPAYIGIDMKNGHYEELVSETFEKVTLSDEFFRFDSKQYPTAEVIDLR